MRILKSHLRKNNIFYIGVMVSLAFEKLLLDNMMIIYIETFLMIFLKLNYRYINTYRK